MLLTKPSRNANMDALCCQFGLHRIQPVSVERIRFMAKPLTQVSQCLLVSIFCLTGASSCARPGGGAADSAATVLTIKGSDTMVHLVSAWAEAYMREHPETEISVTGGGSGTGFAALLNGTTDICAASRAMMPKERELAEARGQTPRQQTVARDGVAIIVHPSNPLRALSVEQVGKIFTGAVTNWQQVGGPNRPIIVFSRDTSSGTFVYFQEHVLGKRDFSPDARLLPANSAVVQSVAADQGAVGYVGYGFAVEGRGSVTSLAISPGQDQPAVEPSADSIHSGRYVLARPLRLFTLGEPRGLAAAFVEFCLSADGQTIVRRTGYVAVK